MKISNEEDLLHKKSNHLHTITHCLYIQTGSLILNLSGNLVWTAILNLRSIKLAYFMDIFEYMPKIRFVSQRNKILLFTPVKPVMCE